MGWLLGAAGAALYTVCVIVVWNYFQPRNPFDLDGDGKVGGSLPKARRK